MLITHVLSAQYRVYITSRNRLLAWRLRRVLRHEGGPRIVP